MTTLYIEGTSETDNGNLRKAFSLLLEKELLGNMPRIIMGDGKNQTIDKFHSTPLKPGENRFLLFDSDEASPDKQAVCDNFNAAKLNRQIDATVSNTFLMIQEVEAWILSQPDILSVAGVDMSRFNIRNVEAISKPSEKLKELYTKSNKTYTKVREFVKIFPKLDSARLKQSCREYNALIDALSKS